MKTKKERKQQEEQLKEGTIRTKKKTYQQRSQTREHTPQSSNRMSREGTQPPAKEGDH